MDRVWSKALVVTHAEGSPPNNQQKLNVTMYTSSNTSHLLRTALLACVLPLSAWAQTQTITASSTTYIALDNGDAGDPATFHDTALGATGSTLSTSLVSLKPTNQDFQSYPLVKFDLSSFSGDTVTSNGTFSLFVTAFNGAQSRSVSLNLLQSPFDPQSTTYDNFYGGEFSGGPWGATIGSVQPYNLSNGANNYYSFTIPQATLQSWIDSPSANNGFAFVETFGDNGTVVFSSSSGGDAPELSFSTVPEPSTYAAIAGSLMLVSVAILRRKRATLAA